MDTTAEPDAGGPAPGPRRRRRAVGPPGASPPVAAPRLGLEPDERDGAGPAGDDERLRRDRPPHHDQGV